MEVEKSARMEVKFKWKITVERAGQHLWWGGLYLICGTECKHTVKEQIVAKSILQLLQL